jgi:hypothetical protein
LQLIEYGSVRYTDLVKAVKEGSELGITFHILKYGFVHSKFEIYYAQAIDSQWYCMNSDEFHFVRMLKERLAEAEFFVSEVR